MTREITMNYPPDTVFTGAIRLAVSGIAEHMGFGLEEIEDLKACISESCLLLLCGQKCEGIFIKIVLDGGIGVSVSGGAVSAGDGEAECSDFSGEISRLMVEALADEVDVEEENGLILSVAFSKKGVV